MKTENNVEIVQEKHSWLIDSLKRNPSLISEEAYSSEMTRKRFNLLGKFIIDKDFEIIDIIKKSFPEEFETALNDLKTGEFKEILAAEMLVKSTERFNFDNPNIKVSLDFLSENGFSDIIATSIKSDLFAKYFSFENNTDFFKNVEPFISPEEFFYNSDNKLKKETILNLKKHSKPLQDIEFVRELLRHIKEEDKKDVIYYLSEKKISNDVAGFLKDAVYADKNTSKQVFFRLLKNTDFDSLDFVDLYEKELSKLTDYEAMEAIETAFYCKQSDVLINLLEDRPHLMKESIKGVPVENLWFNEKGLSEFKSEQISFAKPEIEMSFLDRLLDENKQKKLNIAEYFLNRRVHFSQEEADDIIQNQYGFYSSPEMFKRMLYIFETSAVEFEDNNIWKNACTRTTSPEVIDYMLSVKDEYKMGNTFIYLINNRNENKVINHFISEHATPLQRGMFLTLYSHSILTEQKNSREAKELISAILDFDVELNVLTKTNKHLVDVTLSAIRNIDVFNFKRKEICLEEKFINKVLSYFTEKELNELKSENYTLTECIINQVDEIYLLHLIKENKLKPELSHNLDLIIESKRERHPEICAELSALLLKEKLSSTEIAVKKTNRL